MREKDYAYKQAKRFTINNTNQDVWISNKHLLMDGTIRKEANLDYIISKARLQNNLKYAGLESEDKKLIKKLATLTVKKSADYLNTIVKALKDSGFTVVQEQDGLIEDIYIIAEK